MRLPVSRLMMCRRTRLDVLVAVYIATAHETSESLRYPFQMGRGAMMRLGAFDAAGQEWDAILSPRGPMTSRRINGLAQSRAWARLSLICAFSPLWCKAR